MPSACGTSSLFAAVLFACAAACNGSEKRDESPVPSASAALLPGAAKPAALPPPPDVAAGSRRREEDGRPAWPPRSDARARARTHPGARGHGEGPTTRAGPRTERCSTARSRAASRPRFPLNRRHPRLDRGRCSSWSPARSAGCGSRVPSRTAPVRARAHAEGDLVFDVELLEVVPGPRSAPVPEDVKAPPATADEDRVRPCVPCAHAGCRAWPGPLRRAP